MTKTEGTSHVSVSFTFNENASRERQKYDKSAPLFLLLHYYFLVMDRENVMRKVQRVDQIHSLG